MDPTIICFLPTTSEIEPKMSMLTAKASVVNVRERLEVAGVTLNDSLNSGMSGCAVYKIAKVLKPAAKKAIDTLLNAGVPFSIKSIRSEEHTSELQSRGHLVCRLLLEKKKP